MSHRDMHTGCTILTGISNPKEMQFDITVRGCDWSFTEYSERVDRLLVAAKRALQAELAAIMRDDGRPETLNANL